MASWHKLAQCAHYKYHIKVRFIRKISSRSSARCWNPKNQWVTIGIRDPAWLVLITLAHEIGHCLSVRSGKQAVTAAEYLMYRFGYVKDADRILKEERRAWDYGFRFLKSNGIRITKKFLWARDLLLETHVKRIHGKSG